MESKKIYYEEINIAKGIGIILVVLGHAFPNIKANGMSGFIFDYIYSFHMPLFIFLAGFVSQKYLFCNKNLIRKTYIKERFSRLIIPYFALGLLYLPLKLLLSNSANVKYSITELWRILVGNNPNFALWTLYTLFIMALITVVFINKNNLIFYIIVSIPIMIISYFIPNKAIGIYMVLKNIIFYLMGIYLVINYKNAKPIISSIKLCVISGIMLFVVNYIKFKLKNLNFNGYQFLNISTSILGILFCLSLSIKITYNNILRKILLYVGEFTMDIYVKHIHTTGN